MQILETLKNIMTRVVALALNECRLGRADVCIMASHIAQGTTKILFHEICLRMQQQRRQPKVCLSFKVYFTPEINQIALVER